MHYVFMYIIFIAISIEVNNDGGNQDLFISSGDDIELIATAKGGNLV